MKAPAATTEKVGVAPVLKKRVPELPCKEYWDTERYKELFPPSQRREKQARDDINPSMAKPRRPRKVVAKKLDRSNASIGQQSFFSFNPK